MICRGGNAVPRFARTAALRSTALSMSLSVSLAAGLTLAFGLSVWPGPAVAKDKIPLPKPRPISRNMAPKIAAAAETQPKEAATREGKGKSELRTELNPETGGEARKQTRD